MTNSTLAPLLPRLLAALALALALLPATAHAGTVALLPGAGNLVYDAAPGERNRVIADYDGEARRWTVRDDAGVASGPGCQRRDAMRAVCPGGSGSATLRLHDGDDAAALTGTGLTRAVLAGGPGKDTLRGGGGDDAFVQGRRADGADELVGGLGDDFVDYSGRRRPVRAGLDGGGGDGQRGEGDTIHSDVEGLLGGRGADRLRGNGLENSLHGGPGPDRLAGGGGYDWIHGGTGNDGIRARDGSIDIIACGPGRDRARLDGLDFFSGRCEKVRRNRTAGATVLHVGYRDDGTLQVRLGCPADAPVARCAGRLAVAVEGKPLGGRRVDVARGGRDALSFELPSDLAARLRAGDRTAAMTVVRARMGRIRRKVTVRWSLPLRG